MGYRQLSRDERYVMANMLRQRYSHRVIAKVLDRSPSTISRERKRNASSCDGGYRVEKAQEHAMARRWRSRKKSQFSQQEWDAVADQLRDKWSPAQIAGRRKLRGGRQMSKETIYRYVRRERKAGGR
jgi:IS30 family transposase